MKRLIFTVLFAAFATTLAAQELYEGIVFMENEPWETVLEKARAEDRLIFMDCYTTWCGPCKVLSEKVFPLKEVGDFFNANFINTKYDMEKGDGKMLYERYKDHIPGFPSLLLINADGEVVHQMAGSMEPEALIEGMRAGIEGNSLFAIEARYEAGDRTPETVKAYIKALKGAVIEDKLKAVAAEYLDGMEDFKQLEDPEEWALVGEYVTDPYSRAFTYVVDNIDRGFAVRAKTDRYTLESRLGRFIANEVRDIVKANKSTDADTVGMMRQREAALKTMLERNTVKRFPELMAKLLMNDLMLENKPVELYDQLAVIRPTGVFRHESAFLADCYGFVIDNVKDKKLVRAALAEVLALQGPKKETIRPLATNYYDIIARGHAKLGEKDKAAGAQASFDEIDAVTKAYVRELFKDFLPEEE